jgi:hypothetical protein
MNPKKESNKMKNQNNPSESTWLKKAMTPFLAVFLTLALVVGIVRAQHSFLTSPTPGANYIQITSSTIWTNTNTWLVICEFINGVTNLVYTNAYGSNVWGTTGGVGVTNTGYLGLLVDANGIVTNNAAKLVVRAFGQ